MTPEKRKVDTRSIAYQSHEEYTGLAGMPRADRMRHEQSTVQVHVAESPDATIALPKVIVHENP